MNMKVCPVLPHTQELRLLSGSRRFRLHLQTVDVSDGDDGGGHIPRQTHEGADHQQNRHPEQIQMVTCPFLVRKTNKRSKVMFVRTDCSRARLQTHS